MPGEGSGIAQQPGDSTPVFTPALTPDTGDETPTPSGEASETPAASATATATPAPTEAPTETATPEPTAPPQIEYTVQTGDSWNSIADAYGVDAATLASYNGYALSDILPLGITLVIPQ